MCKCPEFGRKFGWQDQQHYCGKGIYKKEMALWYRADHGICTFSFN